MSELNTDDFKAVLKDKINEYCRQAGFPDGLAASPPTVRGKSLLRFYLYEIYQQSKDIDEEIIEEDITDGQSDLGIDFLNISENVITIIQSKYGKNNLSQEALNSFLYLPTLIMNKEYVEEEGNKDVRAHLDDINKIKNPVFRIIFLHDHPIDKKDKIIKMAEEVENVECNILDFSNLKAEYIIVTSINKEGPLSININIENEDCKLLETINKDYKTYLVTQKGTKIQNIYNQHKETLFNYNIRLWLGRNPVNNSMIETIAGEPENFFFYNNGITAVCEDLDDSDVPNILHCRNFQIINGAQTVTTIAKQKCLEGVKVFLRIIQAEKNKNTKRPEGLNEQIVKNNNNQTAITISDFRSNDSIQIYIEKELEKYPYKTFSPIKDHIFYKRKRRKELDKKNFKVITMQDLGKSFYSFTQNPHELNAALKPLWDISQSGLYYNVFGNDGRETKMLSSSRLNEMVVAFMIYEYIKQDLKTKNKEDDPCVLFKYHLLYAVGFLLRAKHTEDICNRIFSEMIFNGYYLNKTINLQKWKQFDYYYRSAVKSINVLVKSKKNEKATFILRNLQRNATFTEDVQNFLREEKISLEALQ